MFFHTHIPRCLVVLMRRKMREIVCQMIEYEAEENDEELRNDAEYSAALEELKHRLEREGNDEDELEDRSACVLPIHPGGPTHCAL